jgi:hypothetical protein
MAHPSTTNANGIWDISQVELYVRAAQWPIVFVPSDITGLQCWLDASDASTLYDSASGGSLVVAGGSVARWEDKSGNGNHVTGSSMTRTASGQNSLDVISIANAGTRYLGMSVAASDWTVFVAYDSAQAGAGYLLDAQTGRLILSHYAGSGDVAVYDGAWNEVAPTVLSTPNLLTFRLQSGGTNAQIFRDGTQIGSNFSYTQTAIGGNVGFFQSKDGYPFLAGDAYEFLIYQGALTTSDQQAVENYLMTKWGIA